MKRINTRGIILSRTDFGEADRIISVLTPELGKMRLMAKGVRRAKSKMAGGIELFSIGELTIMPGKGDISTLISSRLAHHWGKIVQDVDRTMLGYQVLKIVNKTTEDSGDEGYFELVKHALDGLDDSSLDIRLLELWFDLQLLKVNGHSPNLHTETSGGKLLAGKKYTLDLDNMAFEASTGGSYNANHIKLLRLALSATEPLKLKKLQQADKATAEALKLTKAMLARHLDI